MACLPGATWQRPQRAESVRCRGRDAHPAKPDYELFSSAFNYERPWHCPSTPSALKPYNSTTLIPPSALRHPSCIPGSHAGYSCLPACLLACSSACPPARLPACLLPAAPPAVVMPPCPIRCPTRCPNPLPYPLLHLLLHPLLTAPPQASHDRHVALQVLGTTSSSS